MDNPKTPVDALLHRAKLTEGPERLSLLQQAWQIDPSNREVIVQLALIEAPLQAQSNDGIGPAIEKYTDVIDFYNGHVDAYRERGNLYTKTQKYDLATADFSAAIDMCGYDSSLYELRCKAYLLQKNYDNARTDFVRVGASPDGLALLEFALGQDSNFLDRTEIAKIISKCKSNLTATDKDPISNLAIQYPLFNLYKRLGQIDLENGDYNQAISTCLEAIRYYQEIHGDGIYQENIDVYNCLGHAYSKAGTYKEAVVIFDKIIKERPNYPGASDGRAAALSNIIEKQEEKFQEQVEDFLSGPNSIFELRKHFLEREKEFEKNYRIITRWLIGSLSITLATTIYGAWLIYEKLNDDILNGNTWSFLPYFGMILLITYIPTWCTRILLKTRDRWLILREDCFRKALVMQYIQATGGNKEFRNQIILETIQHLASRGGADLLVALHSDDSGLLYSNTRDIANRIIKRESD